MPKLLKKVYTKLLHPPLPTGKMHSVLPGLMAQLPMVHIAPMQIGYQYSHAYEGNFSPQEYMPDEVSGTTFYQPGNNKHEIDIQARMEHWWKEKYTHRNG